MEIPTGCLILLLLLCCPIAAGLAGLTITVDSLEPSGTVFPPGEHLLLLHLKNAGNESLSAGDVRISISRLHEGGVWNASASSEPVAPHGSWEWSASVDFGPGLHFLEASVGSGTWETTARETLSVSTTTQPRQEWRIPLDVPNKTHRLLAFYYPWYGTPQGPAGGWIHWTPEREYDSTHVPLIGFYDSRSEEVVDYHIRIAQSAGVDAFISSWWGPDNHIDEAMPKLLESASAAGFNITVYVEVAANKDDLYSHLQYLLTEYGSHEAFLKADGRPVVFIYSRVMGQLDLAEFASVFDRLRGEGLQGFYVADRLDPAYLDVFDGIHSYSPLSAIGRYPRLSRDVAETGGLFAATIAPGYDDTIIRDPGLVVDRAEGEYYRESWEMIMLSKPDWVLITSWNEWHEGSEIEPSLEFGDLYLNLTSEYYLIFEEGRLTPRWEDRIREITGLFDQAQKLIAKAEEQGMDARIMTRDLGIAQNVWANFDYETAKLYLLRITERAGEVPEGSVLWALMLILLLQTLAGRGVRIISSSRCISSTGRCPGPS